MNLDSSTPWRGIRRTFFAVVAVSVLSAPMAEAGRAASAFAEGDYIVRVSDEVADPAALVAGMRGVEISRVYTAAFNGFAAHLSAAAADDLRALPQVLGIEADGMVVADPIISDNIVPQTSQSAPPWGLDRIDQRPQTLSGTYDYTETGAGVVVYIVDSGIRADHAEFGGRVLSGFSAVADGRGTDDCDGHGTHVAGIVGGSTYGVAKGVTLRPVRVLDCKGSASESEVIAGINWIIGHHTAGQRAVANLSLGGPANSLVDAAVTSLIADGVTVVAAAGNDRANACYYSPSRVPAVVTVAAQDRYDYLASFSNWGECVDVSAPGVDIPSSWNTSTSATEVLSGTSMAAPHVAGAAALILESHPTMTVPEVANALVGTVLTYDSPIPRLYTGPVPTPVNDSFADAVPLRQIEYGIIWASNFGATYQVGEPSHAGTVGGKSLWWSFTAPFTGTMKLEIGWSTVGTAAAVYTGTDVASLTVVASANRSATDPASTITVNTTQGTTYMLAVVGHDGFIGRFGLTMQWTPRPTNDNFADAVALPQHSTSVETKSWGGTVENGEPHAAGPFAARSVWWTFTAPSNGTLVISTAGSYNGTNLAVYTGTSLATLIPVATNDNYPNGEFAYEQSQVTIAAAAGITYRIAVDVLTPRNEQGALILTLTWGATVTPSNDNFASADPLVAPSSRRVALNIGATIEGSEPSQGSRGGNHTLWWTLTPPTDGWLTLSTETSSIDTLVTVYTGGALDALTPVAFNDDYVDRRPNRSATAAGTSQVRMRATGGVEYHIAVDGAAGAQGEVQLVSQFDADSVYFAPLVNDNFANAEAIGTEELARSVPVTTGTEEFGEPDHAAQHGNHSLWYEFTAPAAGILTVSVENGSYMAMVAVYRGDSLSSLIPVASDHNMDPQDVEDSYSTDNAAYVRVSASAGVTYRVAIDCNPCYSTLGLYTAWSTPALRSVTPARVLDTRPSGSTIDGLSRGIGVRPVGSVTELVVAGRGGVPANAGTVVLNLTAVTPSAKGYATVFPCGSARPTASNLNYTAGAVIAISTLARVGVGGKVCIFTSQASDFVVDVSGYLVSGVGYTPLVPARLLESRAGGATVDGTSQGIGRRSAGSVTTLLVAGRGGVSPDAVAVSLNITAVTPQVGGYLVVFPCGEEMPAASTLNFAAGSVIANSTIAAIGELGGVCIYTSQAADLVVDVSGYFVSGSWYHPMPPKRMLETRYSFPTFDGRFSSIGTRAAGEVTELIVVGRRGVARSTRAVVLNIVAIGARGKGYITVYPCGAPRPTASSMNFAAGQTIANSVVTATDARGKVCIYTSQATDMVVDLSGAFT